MVLRESSCFFILSQNLFKGKSENQIESNPVYSPSSTFPCLSFLPASLLSCVVAWAAFRRPERLSCFTNPSSVSFDFSLCPLSVTRWQPRGPPPPSPPSGYIVLTSICWQTWGHLHIWGGVSCRCFESLMLSVGWHASTNAADTDSTP